MQNIGKSGENQDAYVASANASGSKCFVGVFDGHGEKGHKISDFARQALAKNLFGHKDFHHNPGRALEGAYSETQKQIESRHGRDALQSGTTAVAAYQYRDKLFIANVGDSRIVLGRRPEQASSTELQAIDLSNDQKPGRPDERKRIQDQGGVVQQSAIPVRQTPGGPIQFMRLGPERVWDKNGQCGLSVARSLGDLSMRPYVSSQPEMYERQLDPRDRVLILGSDGVWDHMNSQEAVSIASRHKEPTAAAREIASLAQQRWKSETNGQMADDITAVVVKLDHESASGPPTSLTRIGSACPSIDGGSERNFRSTLSAHGQQTESKTMRADALRNAMRSANAVDKLSMSGPLTFGGSRRRR
jgi:serine/threonine protein phosphatase PrpC